MIVTHDILVCQHDNREPHIPAYCSRKRHLRLGSRQYARSCDHNRPPNIHLVVCTKFDSATFSEGEYRRSQKVPFSEKIGLEPRSNFPENSQFQYFNTFVPKLKSGLYSQISYIQPFSREPHVRDCHSRAFHLEGSGTTITQASLTLTPRTRPHR